MKKIVFKYTIRMARSSRPETHYAFAYTETLARKGLAEMLKVSQKNLWLSKKNLPYKIRKAIFDSENKEYSLTVDIKEKPSEEKSIEERQLQFFDLKASMLKSIKYKVKALARHDKEILLEYADFDKELLATYSSGYDKDELVDKFTYGFNAYQKAYDDIKNTIIKEEFQDEKFDNGFYILDTLDSLMYSITYTDVSLHQIKTRYET